MPDHDHAAGGPLSYGDEIALASELIERGEWVDSTIHPRMALDDVEAGPEYLYRWQTVALIGLAHSQPGWDRTAKRDALLARLAGPADWPLAAAIRVAAEVALHEPTAVREIRQALIDLVRPLENVPNTGILTTLVIALEMLPYVGKDYIETVRSALAARTSDDDN